MVGIRHMVFAATVVMLLLVPAISLSADADEAPEATHYCYGETLTLKYDRSDDVDVAWEWTKYVEDSQEKGSGTGTEIRIDLSGVDLVEVTQTVSKGVHTDVMTIRVKAMHIKYDANDDDKRYTVRFLDGNRVLHSDVLDESSLVESGMPFVIVADAPQKDGFTFLGWYYRDGNGKEVSFDPYEPVTSDMDVYAKWVGNGSVPGGDDSGTVVVGGTHIVTFKTEPGLYYTVNSSGKGAISFTVSVYDGFHYRDVKAVSDKGTVNMVGTTYTISGISSDITVTISGERMYAVNYRLPEGISVYANGYGDNPELVSGGALNMSVEGSDGMSIFVQMGSEDVTDEYVSDGVISIPDVTGDLFVLVVGDSSGSDDGGFPWWVLVAIVLIIAVAVVAVVYLRSR